MQVKINCSNTYSINYSLHFLGIDDRPFIWFPFEEKRTLMVSVYTLFIIDSINTSDIFNIKYIILVNIIQNRIIYTYNNT